MSMSGQGEGAPETDTPTVLWIREGCSRRRESEVQETAEGVPPTNQESAVVVESIRPVCGLRWRVLARFDR